MTARSFVAAATAVALGLIGVIQAPERAAATPILSTAGSFAVLGASTVTNTGPTTITGDLGLYPGTSYTGSGAVTLNGVLGGPGNITDAVALQAQKDNTTAYNILAGLSATGTLTGDTLGNGGTVPLLDPGVYFFKTSAQLNGTLTLDFQNLNDAVFVFQIGTTLTTASASAIDVINPGTNDGIYFQVGSSATLGTTTAFEGNILALDSVTMTTGATISCGRAFAQTGAVTMDTNTISTDCSDTGYTGGSSNEFESLGYSGAVGGVPFIFAGTPTSTAVPEPSTLALFGGGLVGLFGFAIRRRRATV
jgi:ice-binding like protein/PEP-CTERM motif-containing protein